MDNQIFIGSKTSSRSQLSSHPPQKEMENTAMDAVRKEFQKKISEKSLVESNKEYKTRKVSSSSSSSSLGEKEKDLNIQKQHDVPELVLPVHVKKEESITGDNNIEKLYKGLKKADECYVQFKVKLKEQASRSTQTEKDGFEVLNLMNIFYSQIAETLASQGIMAPTLLFSQKSLMDDYIVDFIVGLQALFPEKMLKKINEELNKRIVIDFKRDITNRKNSKIIATFLDKDNFNLLLEELSKAVKSRIQLEILQAQLRILWEFREAVYRAVQEYRKQENTNVFFAEINRTIDKLKIKDGFLLKEKIPEMIISKYLTSQFKRNLIGLMQKSLKEFKQENEKIPCSYKEFTKRIYANFNTMGMDSPFEEWIRAVKGGWIIVLDNDDKIILEPYKEKMGENEEISEARINEWVLQITKVISIGLFQDETVLLTCFAAIQEIVKEMFPDERFEGFNLKVHQILFQKLMSCLGDEEKMLRIQNAINEKLKKENPNCRWDAQVIIHYIMLFYRAPSQTMIWGLTGALRSIYDVIFPGSNLMNTSANWESDKIQQIRIKFTDTEIQFNFLRRGFIIHDKCIWLQNLQVLIPKPGGKELKTPVSANFYYSYPEGYEVEEEIRKFISKLSLVIQAWGFPDLLRDTTETDINNLVRQAIQKLRYPFTPLSNSESEKIQKKTIHWLKKFNILSEEQLLKVSDSNFGYFIGNCHPNTDIKIVNVIADWGTSLFIFDDMVESSASENEAAGLHERILSVMKGEKSLPKDFLIMKGIEDLSKRIDSISSLEWKNRFLQHLENYCNATMWECGNRSKKIIPTLEEYFKMRPDTSGTYMMFDFIELAKEIFIPEEVFQSSGFTSLRLIGANLVNWENDLRSASKEIAEGDVHNIIVILKHQFNISYEEAFERAVRMYNDEAKKFEEIQKSMPNFGEFNEAVKKYIEGMHEWISSHHYWADKSSRYRSLLLKEN